MVCIGDKGEVYTHKLHCAPTKLYYTIEIVNGEIGLSESRPLRKQNSEEITFSKIIRNSVLVGRTP